MKVPGHCIEPYYSIEVLLQHRVLWVEITNNGDFLETKCTLQNFFSLKPTFLRSEGITFYFKKKKKKLRVVLDSFSVIMCFQDFF